uniref:Minor capsid protein P9 transmembrane helices domain-containing protein n=1 Tax=viral metagenome TaxID=1070528 RepID=A0A6C0C534_9ZZZZ
MSNFWINDLSIIFSKNHFLEVIPMSGMKFNSKLNAIFRLSIYYFIIVTLMKKNINNIVVPIFVGILTILLYNYYKNIHNISESNDNNVNNVNNNLNISSNNNSGVQGCKMPTKDNPFMNPTFMDYTTGNMEQSCSSYNNSVIRELERVNYQDGLYTDQFDIYGKEHGNRQFYTMPVNSIVNDQGSFAEWCYSRPPTCKEGNGIQCSVNLPSTQDVSGGPGGGK